MGMVGSEKTHLPQCIHQKKKKKSYAGWLG